jgi:hypothetical protein
MYKWSHNMARNQIRTDGFDEAVNTHDSVLIGYIAESAVQARFPNAKHVDRRGYDFLFGNRKMEVKGWVTPSRVMDYFWASIPAPSYVRIDPEAEIVFVAIDSIKLPIKATLVGYIPWYDFDRLAVFGKAGTYRRGGGYRLKYTADTYEVRVDSLDNFKEVTK